MRSHSFFPVTLLQYIEGHKAEVLSYYLKIEQNFQRQVQDNTCTDRFTSPLTHADTYFSKIKKDYNKSVPSVEQAARFLFLENHCQNRIVLDNNYKITSASFNWSPKVFTRQEILAHIGQIRQRELVHV